MNTGERMQDHLAKRRKPDGNHRRCFQLITALFILTAIPTLITDTAAGVTAFGWLMNALCGVMAGGYLYGIGTGAEEDRRSIVFGGGLFQVFRHWGGVLRGKKRRGFRQRVRGKPVLL